MKNIKNLTRIFLLQTFSTTFQAFKKGNKTKTKGKTIGGALGIAVLLAYILFTMGMMYYGYGAILAPFHLEPYLMLVGLVFATLLLLFILTFEIHGHFFKHKDYNLLASMPIPAYQVIVSKFASILLFAYIYQTMFLLPAIVALIALNLVSVLGTIYFLVGFFFMPLFVMAVGTLLALLLNLFLSYFKPNSALTIVVSFVLFLGLMGLMYFANAEMLNLIIAAQGIPNFLYYALPTGVLYFMAVTGGNLGWFALFVVASLFVGGLAVLGLSLTYNNINKWYGNSRAKQTKGKVGYKQHHILTTLLKQEFYRYTHSTIYMFNTFFGMVLLLAASVAGLILYYPNAQLIAAFPNELLFGFAALLICSFVGLSTTTNVSVSMEGNTLYVKKSLPISYEHVMLAKLMLNWLVCLPIMGLSLLVLLPVMIALNFSVWAILGLVVFSVLSLLLFSLFGLMVNLWFPKLEFTTETEVVKQSVSVLITTLSSIALSGALAVVYSQFLASVMNVYWFVALVSGVFALCIVGFAWLLKTKGKQLFHNL